MVGYISKYLSYTQSCVGCIGRLVYSSKTSLWGSPEYTERSMRHWINVGTGCVCNVGLRQLVDYQREMLQKLIIKISDSDVDKSVQSV